MIFGLMMMNLGLLVLRAGLGSLMFFGHGWGKLMNFSTMSTQFPDMLGLGSTVSLGLAVFAEFFCSLAVIVGLGTRLSALPLMATMFVAGFVAHAADPFQRKELAFVYLVGFAAVFLLGAGKFSLDGMMGGNGFLRRGRR